MKPETKLSKEESDRYSRHIMLPELGVQGQERLKRAKVLVIGAGGLGCPVLQYLVAAGVGTIGIVDDDRVDASNLQRQVLFDTEDAGKLKAEVAARKLAKQNPFVRLDVFPVRIVPSNAAGIINDYDVVIDGSDNFPTRYLVNDVCVQQNKPLVFGSVFKFEGQVSVFNFNGGPTYRCLFPEPPADSPNCSEIGVVGVLPGITGALQANEVIKIITGIGEVLSGKLLVLDALTLSIQTFSFERSATPAAAGTHYEEICASAYVVAEVSAQELKRMLESVDGLQLVDVREPAEYSKFNIGGKNIPLAMLADHLHTLTKQSPVVVHCQSGKRSKKAAELLLQNNFTEVFSLREGINGW